MKFTHNLSLEQVQLLPMKSYLSRAKPQHWLSIESMCMSAQRNQPRVGDTINYHGAIFKLIEVKLFDISTAELRFRHSDNAYKPRDLLIHLRANDTERCASDTTIASLLGNAFKELISDIGGAA